MKPYRIHLGYTAGGRDRWRYFDTEGEARTAASQVAARTGVIVAIERTV